jgi:hypothetical protein
MTIGDSDISLFPSPCFRFLSPTFALFASFLFSLSRLSFPSLPSFARFFRLSFFPLPSFARSTPFRILFPGFSLSLPVFTTSAPRFFGFRPYFFGIHPYFCRRLSSFHCSKNTFRQSGGRSRTELPDSTLFFCMIHMAENDAAIWNIPTIYVYLPSHSQKANTSSHPRVRNASQI